MERIGTLRNAGNVPGRSGTLEVVNWDKRQFETDTKDPTSKDRKTKWKQTHKWDGTPRNAPERSGTPETETETETDILVDKESTEAEFEEFWKSKPSRDGSNPKHPARLIYLRLVKSGIPAAKLNAAAKRWCVNEPKPDTEFCPRAVTWLNQRRFEDYHQTTGYEESNLEYDEVTKLWGYKKGIKIETQGT
jgi:hypothetical protein